MDFFSSVTAVVWEAARLMENRSLSRNIREKSSLDYVTGVDTAVQRFLQEHLGALFPDVGFLSEEQESFHWDFRGPLWVLDPVDGTTNLIHDFRHSAISLALIEAGQPQKGIVYSPFSGEMFTAERGGGAFRNGRPILVSGTASMREALLSVGTAPGKRNERGVTKTFERIKRVFAHCQDIRRMGAASLELCYVACGRLDGYFEEHLKPWDYAAGKLIVEEAGGTVCGLDGREAVFLPDREIVAAGGEILGEFLSVLRES